MGIRFFDDAYEHVESWNNLAAGAIRLKVIYQGDPRMSFRFESYLWSEH